MKLINALLLGGILTGGIARAEEAVKTAESPATGAPATGAPSAAAEAKVRYRAGKTIDLDNKSIDGKLRKPDVSVITGAEQKADDGLLRLRTDFMDRIAVTAGEALK